MIAALIAPILCALATACSPDTQINNAMKEGSSAAVDQGAPGGEAKGGPAESAGAAGSQPLTCSYEVQKSFPHDSGAFTEGLVYSEGELIESTGLVGTSSIRRVRLADGQVVQSAIVPPPYFGEGVVKWKDELISLTWQNHKGFRWDSKTMRKTGEFSYTGEGWGLTHDGKQLIMSDGTPVLRFLNPATMKVERKLPVTLQGQPVANINELEWVDGEIYANVWMTDQIIRIDPKTGVVRAMVDLTGLGQQAGAQGQDAVLNGIAYDAKGRRLFVTGKNWPKLFQIAVRGC